MPADPTGLIETYDLASTFVDRLPDDAQVHRPYAAVNPERIELIADAIQSFIAHTVSMLIDAGSERDAVNESTLLHEALMTELKGWV